MDNASLGLVHDHAYWVSDIKVNGTARSGLVDARAENTAVGKPVPYTTAGAGVRAVPYGGVYVEKGTDWRATAQAPASQLTLGLTDVTSATLWILRTNLGALRSFTIVSDSNVPATITLQLWNGTQTVLLPAGHSTTQVTVY
jgi:hypothetical protein